MLFRSINSNRWNADFKCVSDGDCNVSDECVGGFCVTPFMEEGEFIAKAEFTQGNYRAWVRAELTAECGAIRNERKSERCLEGVDAGVEARFEQMISREHCKYLNDDDTPESVLFLNDDAPMVCLSRDEATRICASFGGRLPAREDYDYLFDDRSFSCDNTVMFGIDEFHGYAKKLKAREIAKLTYGPGCGTGKFRRVCDKARAGNTSDGLCDVFGNVSEWASDAGAMGGSFMSTEAMMRDDYDWGGARPWIGFRCIVPAGAVD